MEGMRGSDGRYNRRCPRLSPDYPPSSLCLTHFLFLLDFLALSSVCIFCRTFVVSYKYGSFVRGE